MQRPIALDEEIVLDPKRYIVSKTDTKGIITYGNEYFVEIVGYSEAELIGQPHNIIRHPDMPKIVFKVMWDRINSGKNIKALVKNLAKDGRYYWVITDFEPKYDPLTNKIIGHTAYRKAAPKKAVEAIIPTYKRLLEIEKESGMDASGKFLEGFLELKKMNYDQYIDSLIEYRGLTKLFFETMKKLFRNK